MPLTESQLIAVLTYFFNPFYQILGGIAALAVLALAYWVVIKPFLDRTGK